MAANDDHTRNQLEALGTALVCDVLDALGHRASFLGPNVRAVWPCGPLAGRAVTIGCEAVGATTAPDVEPYGVLFATLDDPRDGTILVISAGDQVSGLWGELLSVAARARGVIGVVMDGPTRDIGAIVEMRFPVFASGTSPLDSSGRQRFAVSGGPIEVGGTTVWPGDWIVADELGAVAVPTEHVDQAIELGIEKMHGESTVRAELEAGIGLGEVFRRHGIL